MLVIRTHSFTSNLVPFSMFLTVTVPRVTAEPRLVSRAMFVLCVLCTVHTRRWVERGRDRKDSTVTTCC